jgi:hypothetical protein
MAAIGNTPILSRVAAREAFRLDTGEALWRTPTGQWVVVARGQTTPFVLNNQVEWDDVALEEEVELTADADGKVRRRGRPIASGGSAWIVPARVRARAIT